MSIEDQFDVAAQDRRAEAAKAARTQPPYVYDRDAVIAAGDLARLARELEEVADQIEAEGLAAEAAEKKGEAEVPEVPGKVDQEPELPQDPAVAPPDPDAPKPPAQGTDG